MAATKPQGSAILAKFNAERALERKRAEAYTRAQGPGGRGRRTGILSGFAGGAIDRLNAGLAHWSSSINADLDRALIPLRAGGRRLGANTTHGRRFLNLVATNMVGTGPKLQIRAYLVDGKTLDKPANDAIEGHFDTWGRTADVGGRMAFAHFLRVLVKSVARDGEALIRFVRGRQLPYGLGLQLLEIDRLDERLNQVLDSGNIIRQGVELDSTLRPVAYWIRSYHTGDSYQQSAPPKLERVLARDMLHVYVQERAEQVRGYTWFHAVLRDLDMHYGYKEAALVAARVGAAKMGVLTRKDPGAAPALENMADGQTEDGTLQMDGEPGEFVEAPAGYELSSWNPDYPHQNFESFVTACLRDVAAGLDVAAHNLTGNMSDVNYSSARIAELSEREAWMVLQGWLAEQVLVPLYRNWLPGALLMGAITMPSGKQLPLERLDKFLGVSRFQCRRWAWVDPFKEAAANEKQIANGLTSRTRIAASQGIEFEDIVDELAQEELYARAAGVLLTVGALAASKTNTTVDETGAPIDPTDPPAEPAKPAKKPAPEPAPAKKPAK